MRSEPWFDDLRASYAASLPAKIACLRDLVADAAARPADPGPLSDLAHGLHRLAGSAGSYGFPEISSALGPWARLVMSASATRAPVRARDLDELRRCLGFVAARAQDPGAPLPERLPCRGPARSARIVVVDDNVDDRRLLRALLEIHYQVAAHADGAKALEAMRLDVPDLVMLDTAMPGMDGLELVRRLRGDPSLRHVPAIALTTHAEPNDRRRLLAAGFDEHVPKPIADDSALIDTMERCLRGVAPRR